MEFLWIFQLLRTTGFSGERWAELMRKRQSHWLALTYYRPCFDFSESVRVNPHTLINIHESSSLLILSAFYTVLIGRIRIIIIVLSVLLLVFSLFF